MKIIIKMLFQAMSGFNQPFISAVLGGLGSALGSSLGGIAGSLGSGFIGDMFGDDNAEDANKEAKEMYALRYRMTVNDMKKAGLNPILAATSGFNPGSGPAMFKADMPSIPDIASSAKSFAQVQETEEKTKQSAADALLKGQQAKESLQKTISERKKQGLMSAQEREVTQKILNLIDQQKLLMSQAQLAEVQKDQTEAQVKLTHKQTEMMKASVKQLNYELERLKDIASVYRGSAGMFLTYTREILGSISALIGGRRKTPNLIAK